ncbi:MAG TPA: hypothetical protein VI306_25385 [Pyrinomonadaceae bacterium]
MSKNKDIEKKLEKEIEKKLEKELHKDKLEKPELKEKPEKREVKEIKERKEFKEPFKEKVEVKEVKEIEKQIFEKGGKEIAETVNPGEEIFQTRSNFSTEADAIAAPKPKESDKVVKEIEKIKPEKEVPEKIQKEQKEQKEIEKIKPEKETPEKIQKEIEKIKPEKELSKHEGKDIKSEKIEYKELKNEKLEIKELKSEIIEKLHQKDLLPEKPIFENDPKGIVENPGSGLPGGDPASRAPLFKAEGKPEDRLTDLENAVTRLTHFIGVDLRPDLSEGALKGEPDVANEKKPDDEKTKKPR